MELHEGDNPMNLHTAMPGFFKIYYETFISDNTSSCLFGKLSRGIECPGETFQWTGHRQDGP